MDFRMIMSQIIDVEVYREHFLVSPGNPDRIRESKVITIYDQSQSIDHSARTYIWWDWFQLLVVDIVDNGLINDEVDQYLTYWDVIVFEYNPIYITQKIRMRKINYNQKFYIKFTFRCYTSFGWLNKTTVPLNKFFGWRYIELYFSIVHLFISGIIERQFASVI